MGTFKKYKRYTTWGKSPTSLLPKICIVHFFNFWILGHFLTFLGKNLAKNRIFLDKKAGK